MLTPDGRRVIVEALTERLKGARLMVGDGEQRVEAPLDHEPFGFEETIELTATFGEDMANFEWRERGVMVGDTLIDHERADGGRKILGAIWTTTYVLDLEAIAG